MQALFPLHPVLIVDDEIEVLRTFELILRYSGINNILLCHDSSKVMAILLEKKVEVILIDLGMQPISGEELLTMITGDFPEIPLIIITGNKEVDIAVRCMKNSAFDYIVKPVGKNRLVSVVKKAIKIKNMEDKNQLLKENMFACGLENPEAFAGFITNNKTMKSLFQYVEAIAKSCQPILITGDTGVGKELMAMAIHLLHGEQRNFVTVNIAGIDDNVFSDTLFGHIKGAFTGADTVREGLVEKASNGTLFLDEIGDLKHESQVKLLRLLQEGEYFMLGSDSPKTMDTRIIVATNNDLKKLQEKGLFRKDLYYRLSTHHINIPPLNERLDDLPLLLDYFLEESAGSLGKSKPSFPLELITLLSNYHFPGNIRELKAMVHDAVLNHKSKKLSMKLFKKHINMNSNINETNLQKSPLNFNPWLSDSNSLPTMERAQWTLMVEAMKRTNNNQSMAAELLGISRQRLSRYLKKHTETN